MGKETPQLQDTIAAIATAPGRSGLALVRISGPSADEVLLRLAPSLEGNPPSPRTQVLLAVHHPETKEPLDRALVSRFVAPHSYTGEDTVEISCHGGDLTPRLVLDATLAAGARLALPGEFTRRAYLNGKLDLVQAEAVADLIDSQSPAMHRAAIHQMERGLSRRLETLRAAILHAEALAAYSIDFPEEDEPPVPLSRIRTAATEVLARIRAILTTAPEGAMLRRGPLVVFAGHPNSGKSSLFNALLGVERAIVTEIPGTTRDAIEAEVLLGGFPFRLVDTAGLRTTVDTVELLGIEVAQRYLASADIILFCTDSGQELTGAELQFLDDFEERSLVLLRTKTDLYDESTGRSAPARNDRSAHGLSGTSDRGVQEIDTDSADSGGLTPDGRRGLRVSVVTGAGLGQLREKLVDLAFGRVRSLGEEPVITRERHARALRQCTGEIELFLDATADEVPLALAATHLRAAAGAIEDVIGAVTVEDVLDAVFGQFCVGK